MVVVVVGGLAVTTMSNPNPSCIELELGSGFDNSYLEISFGQKCYSDRFFWSKLLFSIRNFLAQNIFGVQILFGPNVSKIFFCKKCLFDHEMSLGQKKNFWTKKRFLDQKKFVGQKIYLYHKSIFILKNNF